MAAVTQLTPNFLGGVSRQSDDKKLDNQMQDVVNAYPDPTYGLSKRGGTNFLWNLNKPDGTAYTEAELKDGFWFYMESTTKVTDANASQYPTRKVGDEFIHPYMGCISQGTVKLWDALNGQPVPVNMEGGSGSYLTRPDGTFYDQDSLHYRSILDTTIICNRNVVVEALDDGGEFERNRVGTVRLNTVEGDTIYSVIIDRVPYPYTSEPETSAAEILAGLRAALPNYITGRTYKTSLELWSDVTFMLEVEDSKSNTYMNSYQDTVSNISVLAKPSKEGRLVEVIGDANEYADNYYLEFTDGEWTETRSPLVSSGLDSSTMPHRVYKDSDGNFNFGPIEYDERLVGDDVTNPMPSFVGEIISASFYYNNRLGFLSRSNVILSAAKNVFNFFGESQLLVLDSDPIDINANSTRPVDLFDVVTQPAGVLLFARRQQFFLSSPETGVLTPTRSIIKAISSYEVDPLIPPLDLGTTIAFVSKMPDYSRLMLMAGEGTEVDPVVIEISKVVTGWLPGKITQMIVSPQNSLVALASKDNNNMYIYRFYNDGKEDKMQAWVRWEMPGDVQSFVINNDMLFVNTLQSGVYSTSMMSLNEINSTGYQLSNKSELATTPYLDFASRPNSIVYDAASNTTKFYTKFKLIPNLKPLVVLTLPGTNSPFGASSYIELFENWTLSDQVTTDADPGYLIEPTTGTDATGDYFSVNGDFTSYSAGIVVGYCYNYEVTLPKLYFKMPAKGGAADFTANLTIGRVRFSVGKSGAVTFKLKAKGADEWVDIQHVTDADYYEADTEPIKPEQIFTVPINQRNKNFQLKVTSDLPFPVSLVSMMWEGQYYPRFYRRI